MALLLPIQSFFNHHKAVLLELSRIYRLFYTNDLSRWYCLGFGLKLFEKTGELIKIDLTNLVLIFVFDQAENSHAAQILVFRLTLAALASKECLKNASNKLFAYLVRAFNLDLGGALFKDGYLSLGSIFDLLGFVRRMECAFHLLVAIELVLDLIWRVVLRF